MKHGFSYVGQANNEKDDMVMQNLLAKKQLLAAENVQLVKLRNGIIIQSADHEEWDDENENFMEDLASAQNVVQAQEVKHLETEEAEVRPYELTILSEGKSAMIARLKKARIPVQIKVLYSIGKPRSPGFAFFLLSLLAVLAELIVFFSRDSYLSDSIDYYSNSVKQSETLNLLLVEIFHVSTRNSTFNAAAKKAELEGIVNSVRSLKNSLTSSQDYVAEVDTFSSVFTIGNLDSRTYRVSEILEQIMSRIITLKENLKSSAFATAFSMGAEDFYFVVMNSMDTLLPKMAAVQTRMYETLLQLTKFDLWALSMTLSILGIVLIAVIVQLVFLKKAMQLRQKLMSPFLMIPESTIKLYHAQNEYFVLLFSGMEDKHVDDLKDEVTALSKHSDQVASSYGKKKKKYSQRNIIQMRTNVFISSLVLCVVLYCFVILYLTSSKATTLSKTVPFTQLQKTRSMNYLSTLNKFYLSAFNSSLVVQRSTVLESFSQAVRDCYSTDAQLSTVA